MESVRGNQGRLQFEACRMNRHLAQGLLGSEYPKMPNTLKKQRCKEVVITINSNHQQWFYVSRINTAPMKHSGWTSECIGKRAHVKVFRFLRCNVCQIILRRLRICSNFHVGKIFLEAMLRMIGTNYRPKEQSGRYCNCKERASGCGMKSEWI